MNSILAFVRIVAADDGKYRWSWEGFNIAPDKLNGWIESSIGMIVRITICLIAINLIIKIGNKYNWQVTNIIENLYRINNPEVIVNGELIETDLSTTTVNKTLSKIYRDYRNMIIKESIKVFINRICGNNV